MPDIYDVVLTGAQDGKPDFIYILKSYNGIHYSDLASHLSFQFPRQSGDIQAVSDRPNGEIVLRKNGIELFRGVPKFFDFYEGANSKTFTISASYLQTESTPKTVTLPVELIDNESDGKRIFKIPGNHDFQPLDSLNYNSEVILIDQVRINIKQNDNYLRLREL